MSKKTPLLSIVIPCLNEAGTVDRLLTQLTEERIELLEVIAVDNRSKDGTLEILNSFKKYGVKVVSDVPAGVSKARNAGAAIASGKWIAFIDADTLMPQNFVIDLLALLSQNPRFHLAAIAYKADTKNILFKALTALAQAYQRYSFYLKREPLIPGAVELVLRSVHESINGFDESLKYNEDFDYSARAYKVAPHFKSLRRPYLYFSVRRLKNGGWRKVAVTYLRAEIARISGKKFDPKEYDMSDHVMK